MTQKLPNKKRNQIETLIYARADEMSYRTLSRPESSLFLDSLVEDSAVAGILPKGKSSHIHQGWNSQCLHETVYEMRSRWGVSD